MNAGKTSFLSRHASTSSGNGNIVADVFVREMDSGGHARATANMERDVIYYFAPIAFNVGCVHRTEVALSRKW